MYGAIRLGIKLFRGINWKAWLKISCTLAAWEAQGIFYVWETEWNWKWFCACKFMVTPLIVISGNKKLKECICWYYSYTKYNNCQSFLSALWMPPAKGSEYDQSYSTMCGHLNMEFLLYIQRVPYYIIKMDFFWNLFIFEEVCPQSMIWLLYSQANRIRSHYLRWEITYSDMQNWACDDMMTYFP